MRPFSVDNNNNNDDDLKTRSPDNVLRNAYALPVTALYINIYIHEIIVLWKHGLLYYFRLADTYRYNASIETARRNVRGRDNPDDAIQLKRQPLVSAFSDPVAFVRERFSPISPSLFTHDVRFLSNALHHTSDKNKNRMENRASNLHGTENNDDEKHICFY